MRGRPIVRVLLGSSPLEPGMPFDVDVTLTSRSETPTEYVDVMLAGDSRVVIPQGKSYASSIRELPRQAHRWQPGTLAPGDHRQRFRFVLPGNSPPSYRAAGGWCRVAHTIEVHVAIPMWIDRRAAFALPVAVPPRVPQGGTSSLTATHPYGPRAGAMYIEASVDATQLAPGEELRGEVSFANVQGKRVRRVTIGFVAREYTREPLVTQHAVATYETTLVAGAPLEGESYPFRLQLPRDLWASFDAGMFALVWALEVRADVVLGTDVVLDVPIQVMRPPAGVELPPRSRRAVPVGRQRLARLWTIVAQRVGLSYDESTASMIASRGPVAMTLSREAHQGTLGIVARYRYPHLGLDLRLGERGFFDAIVGGRFEPRSDAAKKRFSIVGRETPQLSAFFDDALLAYLATTTSASLDDDQAELRIAGAASSAAQLEGVARAALTMLGLLEAAIARVPPPVAMSDALPAWRAFAESTSGRLELGRVWIHEASLDGFRFEVGTVWDPHDVKPRGTVVRVPIDPPLTAAPTVASSSAGALMVEDASLSAVARDALRALQAHPGFHAAPSELGIFTEEVTRDPQTLLPQIQSMTTILRAMRGVVAAGPFR